MKGRESDLFKGAVQDDEGAWGTLAVRVAHDLGELAGLVVLRDVLTTVSTKVMTSAPDGGGDLRLLPIQPVAIFVIELDVWVGCNEYLLQPLGLVSKGIQVLILYLEVACVKTTVCVHLVLFLFLILR